MKTRSILLICTLTAMPLILSACGPRVPDSGAGVGFQSYDSYVRGAGAGVSAPGQPLNISPVGATATAAAPAGFSAAAASAAFDRAEGISNAPTADPYAPAPYAPPVSAASPYAAPVATAPASASGLAADRPRGDAPMGIQSQSGEVAHSNPGISDENDFNAVSQRESIASDAERIARNRSEYVVVEPKALPQRSGDTGPNLAEFALSTQHAPGQSLYSRNSLFKRDVNAACAKYASPDLAQQAFLAKGGPEKDRLGVDPDGDGFACGWDPRPFRAALQ